MSKVNETTRCYPRTLEDAFPDTVYAHQQRENWEWMERHSQNREHWISMAMCFFAGFFVSMVIFVK